MEIVFAFLITVAASIAGLFVITLGVMCLIGCLDRPRHIYGN